ncbi:hypothetical protein [Methylobacterium tardum]|uniref:hypothetical protein n=1 Tax=Methylobacterium tardum TaxID=374432 RepID=UPI00366D3ABA
MVLLLGPDHARRSETIMAIHPSTAPASAGERSCSPSRLYAAIPDFSQPVPIRRPVLIGTVRELPGERRYRSLPDESLPGAIEPWEAVVPVRPDTPHSRALRFLDAAGEMLTAIAIIAGGVFAYGFMPFA